MTMCDPVRTLLLGILLLWSSSFVQSQECDSQGRCDKHERCAVWKEEGECLINKEYMQQLCPVSCRDDESAKIKRIMGECEDLHPRCAMWASLGECEDNTSQMKLYCPQSCGACNGDNEEDEEDDDDDESREPEPSKGSGCEDTEELCAFWAEHGECESNSPYMHRFCAKSCNTCQKEANVQMPERQTAEIMNVLDLTAQYGIRQRADGAGSAETLARIKKAHAYMEEDAITTLDEKILKNCENRHELCAFWASIGECENNKAYMQTNCAPSCLSCHMIDIGTRCPRIEQTPALHPGGLNKMFERILRNAPGNKTLTEEERRHLQEIKMPEYTVHVLSRPSESPATEVSAVLDKSLPPWVIVFENVVTDEECDELIRLGYEFEYKRSEDVGPLKFDGTHTSIQNTGRTSENAWCSEKCRAREVPTRVLNRMETIMGIPANNSEDLQMLRYQKGQFYQVHHDFIPHQVERQCGPRILTFFIYLSDVEKGGGTNFPQLDITVMPKKGSALLWPSVYDSDPMKKDNRFLHQALPVEEGVKYAANGWIHMYDYVTAQLKGCN